MKYQKITLVMLAPKGTTLEQFKLEAWKLINDLDAKRFKSLKRIAPWIDTEATSEGPDSE